MKKRLCLIGGAAILLLCALALALGLSPLGKRLFSRNVNADGLILAVEPSGVIYVAPGDTATIRVTAAKDAAVTVYLGATAFAAEKLDEPFESSALFAAQVTFPESEAALSEIGNLVVSARAGRKTATVQGAKIMPRTEMMTTELPSIGNNISATSGTTGVGNHYGFEIDDETVPMAQAPLAANGQLCIVTAAYADTWSAQPNDATFLPYQTTMPGGTIDFVTGQSQVYDAEANAYRSFYILSSGRKVRSDAVQLLSADKPNSNVIAVKSSTVQNGALELRLQMAWSVPFDFSFAPQTYYSANSERFNVSAFTANQIAFTFHYTSAVQGGVDVGASDVVASAAWTVDTANNTATLTMPLRAAGKYYGYTVRRDADGTFVLTIQNRPKALSGAVIVLDPGHGGTDSGALGFSGALHESQLNFALAVAAKNELECRGAVVYFTRTDDVTMSLEERKAYARQVNPDLFISIHCNAAENKARYGTAVYYYRPMSQPLAAAIYAQTLAVFQTAFYAGTGKASGAGEGLTFHPFSVTRLEECPSVLIETGFITNDDEAMLLLNAANRDKIAAAIATGIENYLKN